MTNDIEEQDDAFRALLAIINAWESSTVYTVEEMCLHIEEAIKVLDGTSDFSAFLKATQFNIKKQLWIN